LLFGTGDLAANSADSIVLTNARANATSALFLALSSNPVPFRGGILQPFPFFFVLVTTTNSAGGIVLPLTIPAGIPGATEIWMQWAILDPAAVQGAALSNALLGVTP